MSLIDTYEEVEDFIESLEKIKNDIPDFDGKIWCEDYLLDVLKVCEDWVEENQEEYFKLRKEEIDELNYEFEKSRL